jgi:hypothetical protein
MEGCRGESLPILRSGIRSLYELSGFSRNEAFGAGEFSALREKLDGLFAGTMVVDIGAGRNTDGYMVAAAGGAKGYMALEPFHHRDLARMVADASQSLGSDGIPFEVRGVGAHFELANLPDDEYSIICAGIDEVVLPDEMVRMAISAGIRGRLSPKGAAIISLSTLDWSFLPKADFEFRRLGLLSHQEPESLDIEVFTMRWLNGASSSQSPEKA